MKFKFFALMAAFTLLIISCKESAKKTPSGYEYAILTEGSGDAAKTGDYVFFTAKITGSDSVVINEIKEGPDMPSLQIPDTFPTGAQANPILEMLKGAKVGSTYKLTMPMDSFPQASPDMAKLKYMEYEVGVKKVMNKADF